MCARVRDVTITMMIVLFIVLFQNQTSNTFGEGTYSIPETLVHPGKLDDARALEPERNLLLVLVQYVTAKWKPSKWKPILRFSSVSPRKMGTLLLGSWWP